MKQCKCKTPKEDYRLTDMYEPYCICLNCNMEVMNPIKWIKDEKINTK